MQATLVCDCGEKEQVEAEMGQVHCPNCQAKYAVTITKIKPGMESESAD